MGLLDQFLFLYRTVIRIYQYQGKGHNSRNVALFESPFFNESQQPTPTNNRFDVLITHHDESRAKLRYKHLSFDCFIESKCNLYGKAEKINMTISLGDACRPWWLSEGTFTKTQESPPKSLTFSHCFFLLQ